MTVREAPAEANREKRSPLSSFLSRVRENPLVFLLIAAGILLLLLAVSGKTGTHGAEKTEADDGRAALESELAALCSEIEGVGRVTVAVRFESGEIRNYVGSKLVSVTPPKVLGVAIVCDGGGDPAVVGKLTTLLSSLLGIGSNRIAVTKRR